MGTKLNQDRKVKIRGVEYRFRKSTRAFFIFEEITNRPFELRTMLDNYLFLYCILLANNPDMNMGWEEFIDAVDEDSGIIESLNECIRMANETEKILNGPDTGEDDEKKN